MNKYELTLKFDGHKIETLIFDSQVGMFCYLVHNHDLNEEELDYLMENKEVSLGLDSIYFKKV